MHNVPQSLSLYSYFGTDSCRSAARQFHSTQKMISTRTCLAYAQICVSARLSAYFPKRSIAILDETLECRVRQTAAQQVRTASGK